MKKNMTGIIISMLLIGAAIHADYYTDISNNLLSIDPNFKENYPGQYPFSEKSSQKAISAACNRQKNFIINELRKTKGGTKARDQLLQDQSAIETACRVLENVKSRRDFDKRGSEVEQEEKDRKELAEAEKKGPRILEKKQKEIADRKKKEKGAGRPQPGDPEYVGGMKGYLGRKFSEHKETGIAKLGDLVGDALSEIEIPPVSTKLFNINMGLKDMSFIKAPTGGSITTAIGFTGITQFNNMDVKVTVYILRGTNKKIQYSLGVDLPANYKISNMFPNFKKLDLLSMPNIKLVASSASYTDPDGYQVQKGFNLVAGLSLDGPLRALGELRKNASKYDFIVVDMAAPIYLHGLISGLTSAEFNAVVPMRLGIDFVKAKKIPAGFSSIISKITTDDFKVGVVLTPTDQTFNAQTGIQIVLGTQQTPLRMQALGGVDILSGKINAAAKIPDMLELKFIAIGDTLLELYWDPAVESILALFGVPVSGIALGGRIDLGKPGDKRVSLSAKGKLSLEVKKLADFVLELEGTNLSFTNIVELVFKMAAKAGIKGANLPAGKIPTLEVSRAYGKLAPWDTMIAGESISAGIQLALDMELFNKKFGFDVTIKHKDLMFSGSGYMPEIVFRNKSGVIFKLAGTGKGGGPSVSCSVNGKNPLESSFGISTILDVPPIALKSSIELQASGKSFVADFETNYLGFTTVFGINIPAQEKSDKQAAEERKKESIVRAQSKVDKAAQKLKELQSIKIAPSKAAETRERSIKMAQLDNNNAKRYLELVKKRKAGPSRWEEMYIKFGFKGDFQKFLSQQAVPAIKQLQKEASAKLAQVDKKIGQLSGELEKLRKQQVQAKQSAGTETQREINKTKATITRINTKIRSLKKECKDAPLVKKTYICPKTVAQITAQGTALAAQETYLNTLLKPGKKVIEVSLDLVNKINKGVQVASTAISEARLFEKGAKKALGGLSKAVDLIAKGLGIFKVTEAIGEVNAQELAEGKAPKLISLQAEVNIPELDPVTISLYNVQFDFKDPKRSAADIALQLIRGVKVGNIDMGEAIDILQ